MMLIANVCPKLQTVKILVRSLSKKRCFRNRFVSQHVKEYQRLAKSPSEHFYYVFSSFLGKLIWKMSSVVFDEILGVFLDTLPVDAKYPVEYYENLRLQIQMQLSEKRKPFSEFLFHFWIIHKISNILKKKMMVIANVFPKLQTVKILVRPLSKKRRFRKRFDRQHVKVSQILAKAPLQHIYHVC